MHQLPRLLLRLSSCALSLCVLMLVSTNLQAKDYFVETKQDYKAIASDLQAGDTVTLQNGNWSDFEILLTGEGKKDAPITLKAETKGQVIISGQSNLRLAGKHLVVSGLVFKNGFTPSSSVIEFRQNKGNFAYHSRVTEVVIDNFNNPDKQESDYWIAFYGKHNRLDHSHIVGKRNKGVTLAVRLNSEDSQENYHKIDHNYFGHRPTFGSNGGETLRIGTSHYSLTDSFTLVENNIFERTNGEVEIISVKSGKNTLRGNLFYESRGTLTMRHGNGNIIEENVFIGNGVDHTGGIRVINKDQIIRHNYLQGLTGYRFGSGFTVMNGVPNSPINRYHQVENALIENNTFINIEHIQLAAGSDAERSAVPINSTMRNNLFVNGYTKNDLTAEASSTRKAQQPFTAFDDVSGIKFENNVSNTQPINALSYGIETKDVKLEKASNGLLYPISKALSELGAKRDLTVIGHSDVGVSWYPKLSDQIKFDSGELHSIDASSASLVEAITKAKSGDIIEIAQGELIVPRLIKIDKVLTIKAKQSQKTSIGYERTALFEIHDGGSLKLSGLVISGKNSPDAAGNSVVRTRKWGMLHNYRFVAQDCAFVDLDINHSFDVFVSGKGAFADDISLIDNTFSDVTGNILMLNKEIEDLGIYNAEYVTLKGNEFVDVQGSLINLYRGGTDESTFGPHLHMTSNLINNVGKGKRNKSQASVYLHGVQVSDISNNTFTNASPIIVEHTVGEPKTNITDNTFIATPSPDVKELRVKGPHTAVIKNNTSR